MRGLVLRLGLLACVALSLSGSNPPAAPHEGRAAAFQGVIASVDATRGPAFKRDFPDPSVIVAGGRYYAFATQTGWEPPGHVFPILVSRDLAGWSYAGDVFSKPPAWGRGDWWAPAVIARGGTYFLYYSGYGRSGAHCLAVATASLPAGPYTDHGPIACKDATRAAGYIDASPMLADGRGYIYFSVDGPGHHSISVLPLSADLLSAAGPRTELLDVTAEWEKAGHGTVEGPSVFAWGSHYLMLYSGGDWRGPYGMGYAVGASPVGPFVKTDRRLLGGDGSRSGLGGGSFFTDSSGRPWLAYHAWLGTGRALYLSPLAIS